MGYSPSSSLKDLSRNIFECGVRLRTLIRRAGINFIYRNTLFLRVGNKGAEVLDFANQQLGRGGISQCRVNPAQDCDDVALNVPLNLIQILCLHTSRAAPIDSESLRYITHNSWTTRNRV